MLADLHDVVHTALLRGGHLLSAGEGTVCRALAALSDDPGRLYARLVWRVGDAHSVPLLRARGIGDIPAAAAALAQLGLVDALVPRPERCVPRPLRSDPPGPFLRVRHRGLLLRLLRFATLRTFPDPAAAVLDRIGVQRWAVVARTDGPALFRDRRALLRWEALVTALDAMEPPALVDALVHGIAEAPGDLGQRRRIARRLVDHAERIGRDDPATAARLWATIRPWAQDPVAEARCQERAGRPDEALATLQRARTAAAAAERLAIGRAGRRVARVVGSPWAPDPPLHAPVVRSLRLDPAAPDRKRPRFTVHGVATPVESAVVRTLQAAGRRALHAEGGLWQTLAALLLADACFLPLPGAFPVPRLDAPLDRWSPAFRARRADVVAAVLDALRSGAGPARTAEAAARWHGTRMAGADARWSANDLLDAATALPAAALADIVDHMVDDPHGGAGLPDLLILPGPAIRLDAVPDRVPDGPLLVEIKTPHDKSSDAQRVWFDRLVRGGARVEQWEVRARPRT